MSSSVVNPDWDFDYSEMTEEEALAKAAEAYAKCRLLCESDYCMSICSRQLNDLKLEVDAYFNPEPKNAEDLWFCVQRGGKDYRVLGRDIQDKCKDGDKFAVWRAGTVYQWERRETNHAWEKQTFWYHVKNLTEELFLWPRDKIGIIWDKSTGERVERMLPGGEYMIAGYNEEGHKVRFEGNSGNWDFGDESDTSLLTDGRRFFANCPNFNGDVSVMASSVWATVEEMFLNCTSFNQPIGDWYLSEVKNNWELYDLFKGASAFDQDLSSWCMWRRRDAHDIVKLSPDEWAEGAPIASQPEKHPQWMCYKEAVTRTIRVDDGSAM